MKLKNIVITIGFIGSLSFGQNQPNIIYILADDMGTGDVKAYNKDCKFPTPNIDQLALDGMKFTDLHTNSSVCTPTRYGILTGRYAWRTRLKNGVTHGLTPHLINTKRTTIASYLKTKGYATAVFGKWHLGMDWTSTDGKKMDKTGTSLDTSITAVNGPQSLGFDEYFGITASLNMDPHAYVHNGKLLGDLKHISDAKEMRKFLGNGGKLGWVDLNFKEDEVMQTFTNKAIDWMKSQKQTNPNTPFFLYFPLNAPHSPIVPSDKFKGQSNLSPHGDFCMDVDDTVGQIIAAVEAMGETENTLIVFTADNGVSPQAKLEPMEAKGHYSSYVYRGTKGTLYEGGHRVPFIVKWPKSVKQNTQSDYLMCTTDLLATAADIFEDKLKDNEGEDSVSFLPVLKGESRNDASRGAIVHHSDVGFYSIRKDQWKLIFHKDAGSRRIDPKDKPVINPGEIQLFNMKTDFEESTNVATHNPEIVLELSKLMGEIVSNGRSTNGTIQKDEPYTSRSEKTIKPFSKYIK